MKPECWDKCFKCCLYEYLSWVLSRSLGKYKMLSLQAADCEAQQLCILWSLYKTPTNPYTIKFLIAAFAISTWLPIWQAVTDYQLL